MNGAKSSSTSDAASKKATNAQSSNSSAGKGFSGKKSAAISPTNVTCDESKDLLNNSSSSLCGSSSSFNSTKSMIETEGENQISLFLIKYIFFNYVFNQIYIVIFLFKYIE